MTPNELAGDSRFARREQSVPTQIEIRRDEKGREHVYADLPSHGRFDDLRKAAEIGVIAERTARGISLDGTQEAVEPADEPEPLPVPRKKAPPVATERANYSDGQQVSVGDVVVDKSNNMSQVRETINGMWKINSPSTGTMFVENIYFKGCKLLKRNK